MSAKIDLTGNSYKYLTVIEQAGVDKYRNSLWRCRCVCGGEKIVSALRLKTRPSVSCGCQWGMKPRHGEIKTRLYNVWNGMRSRCNTPTAEHYDRYGGRGIKVCPEWDSYEAFRDWAHANGYDDSLTLDRRDNDGDYTPTNCRWATRRTQTRNRNNTAWVTVHGERMRLTDAADRHGIDRSTFAKRLARGWTPERAITKPQWTR